MSCKLLHTKLFICGLHIIFVLWAFAVCKANGNGNHIGNHRFINPFTGLGDISKSYCNSACGQTKFLFASVLKRYCQQKCPNSTIALVSLESTASKPNLGSSVSPTQATTAQASSPGSSSPSVMNTGPGGVNSMTTPKVPVAPQNQNPTSKPDSQTSKSPMLPSADSNNSTKKKPDMTTVAPDS